MPDSVVIGASLAQRPGYGGHAWALLQYALGFRELGLDVTVIDRLEQSMLPAVDSGGARAASLDYVQAITGDVGLGSSYCILDESGRSISGISRDEALGRIRQARFLLNVMGFVQDAELLAAARRRVFLDIDPGFGQMWAELGLANVFEGHDLFVTVGRNIGSDRCEIPTCGLSWLTLPHPVVLSRCAVVPSGDAFRSIGSWRGPYAPVEFEGKRYGLRAHQLRAFAELPGRAGGGSFELALDIEPADEPDRARLVAGGWTIVDPHRVAWTPDAYVRFVQAAGAEVTVAKDIYVATQSGWLGDRTVCFLAHGRPALVQDTGLGALYPIGDGLLTFATLDDAITGVRTIREDYQHHAAAARRLAEREFDARLVLGRLLDEAG